MISRRLIRIKVFKVLFSRISSGSNSFLAGEKEKGMAIANEFIDETIKSINMFATQHRGRYLSKRDIESNLSFLFYVSDIFKNRGYSKESEELEANVNKLIESL